MTVSAREVFVAMYYILDVAYEKACSEELRQFLSDANPFLFKDGGSADPAVFIEFEQAFDAVEHSELDEADSLAFVQRYLEHQDPELKAAFDSVADSSNWRLALNSQQ